MIDADGAIRYRKQGLKESPQDGTINGMRVQDVTENYIKDATPGKGSLAYAAGYQMKTHRKEMEIGKWVHNTLGGDIILLQEDRERNKKTPDYIWLGAFWELKSISSAKAADSALRGAVKQIQENPGGVILELGDGIDMGELEKILSDRFRRVQLDELDILVLAQGIIRKVLRYKK